MQAPPGYVKHPDTRHNIPEQRKPRHNPRKLQTLPQAAVGSPARCFGALPPPPTPPTGSVFPRQGLYKVPVVMHTTTVATSMLGTRPDCTVNATCPLDHPASPHTTPPPVRATCHNSAKFDSSARTRCESDMRRVPLCTVHNACKPQQAACPSPSTDTPQSSRREQRRFAIVTLCIHGHVTVCDVQGNGRLCPGQAIYLCVDNSLNTRWHICN